MKFHLLTETHFSERNLNKHYNERQHTAKDWKEFFSDISDELLPPMTASEYDDRADEISKKPVRTSSLKSGDTYVGFMGKDSRIVKYDTVTGELVVYVSTSPSNSETITYYKADTFNNHKRYRKLLKDYVRELTPEDDKYNK